MPQRNRPFLTPTQWWVLARMAAGDDNAAIAQALGLSPSTITGHVSAIYRALAPVGRGRGKRAGPVGWRRSKRTAAIEWYLTVGRALCEQEMG